MSTASLSSIGACLALTRAISRATSNDDIYTASLDVLGQALGTSRVAILLFEPDGVMRFKAWRGLSAAYRAAVEGHSPWAPDSPQPRPIIVSDVGGDPSLAGYQSVFDAEGIGALAFIPLVSMGQVIGKFMLYYDTPHILRDDEVQLAEVIAAQVAFALARVTAEESLRVTDERMRFALDAAAMGTWELDLPDRSMKWSGNLERVHGYEPGDFDNSFERYAQIIHTEDRERVLASLDFAAERGRPYDIEYRVVGPDGVVRWIESKGRVEYEDGRAVRMTGICMAVTRRKQAEFARLADAHEANELKDQFLATLSHELRTPLNAILGWIQVLEHDLSSPDRVRHAMDIVKRNAKLQAQLIEDILDVSRIINGKLSIETQSVNMTALVDSAVSGLLPAAALKQIEMSCEIADRLPAIDGDPRRLQQVLNNVIANAIKFTPEGGSVRVRCAAGDGMLQIEVQDSGVGIDPELLPHVFDRFRQGDSRSTRRHGGLGLGLAIARHLVERHEGTIEAHSDGVDRGTTFAIRLPIPVNTVHTEAPSAAAAIDALDLSGYNVLIVDDQEDSRELLVHLLHKCSARVLQCPSAHTALAAMSATRFDLLVADIAMPETDGLELIEHVRRQGDARGRIPAVAVTAYARTEDRERVLTAGYDGYCPKPLDAVEFLTVVSTVLEMGESARV